MHKVIAVCNTRNHQSVKPITIPPDELVAEFIQIVLYECVLHIMKNIKYLPLGIADYNVNPW